jgi:hypothetical protein
MNSNIKYVDIDDVLIYIHVSYKLLIVINMDGQLKWTEVMFLSSYQTQRPVKSSFS